MNVSLLCKWWWALENEEGLWQDIVRLKYVRNSPTCLIPARLTDSPVWSDLMKIRHIHLKGSGIKINNGQHTSFWLDIWMGDTPLCLTYPILYEEAINNNCSVLDVKRQGWVVQFRTRLHGVIREQWYALTVAPNNFTLNESRYESYWKWTTSKMFTVKSVYEHLTIHDDGPEYKRVWKAKIPAKIKVFMWLMSKTLSLPKTTC
jgi:hypothetical protein